jgi:hypothetical protein
MRVIAQLIGRKKWRVDACAQRCRGRSSTYPMLPLATLVHSTHCSNEKQDVAQIGLHESTTHARAGSVVVVVATVTSVAAVSLAVVCAAAKHHGAAAHLCKRERTPCMHRALVPCMLECMCRAVFTNAHLVAFTTDVECASKLVTDTRVATEARRFTQLRMRSLTQTYLHATNANDGW